MSTVNLIIILILLLLLLLLLIIIIIIIIIVFIKKTDKNCQIIYVAIPEDGWVREKEDGKVEKYLVREV